MKNVWNKRIYIRTDESTHSTWALTVEDDYTNDGWTEDMPLGLDEVIYPSQHWDDGWVLDEAVDQGELDSHSIFAKLSIRRAMQALDQEAILDGIIADEVFGKEWADALEIDLNEQIVQDALLDGGLDDDDRDNIKRKILEMGNQ